MANCVNHLLFNFSSDDVNDEMSKLKEALSRSSEKDIQFSNKYLDELNRTVRTQKKTNKKAQGL